MTRFCGAALAFCKAVSGSSDGSGGNGMAVPLTFQIVNLLISYVLRGVEPVPQCIFGFLRTLEDAALDFGVGIADDGRVLEAADGCVWSPSFGHLGNKTSGSQ